MSHPAAEHKVISNDGDVAIVVETLQWDPEFRRESKVLRSTFAGISRKEFLDLMAVEQ